MTASHQTTVTIDDVSYVPQINIAVNKRSLPASTIADVLDLKVTLQKDEPGGFTMTLANHFTILEGGGDQPLRKFQHSDDNALDILDQVTVEMGYVGRMKTLFVGEIQTLQPSFPSSGIPTLTVTGTDFLNRLRLERPGADQPKSFPGVPDHEIARRIARRHRLEYSKDSVHSGPASRQPAMQRDMDDLTFILYLAKRNDYECSVLLENNKPALYFGVPRDRRDGRPITQVGLAWGRSLISFTPKLRIGRQVSRVTVRGWDSRNKSAFEYTARLSDLPRTGGRGRAGCQILEERQGAKEYRIVDRPVHSMEEARRLAIQLLTETANEFLTGSGEAMGEPLIRPQVNVRLDGIGRRFDGEYYVTKADHVFGAAGYTTSFEVERMREEQSLS